MRERRFVVSVIAIVIMLTSALAQLVFDGIIPAGQIQLPIYLFALLFALAHGHFLLRAAFAAPELALLLGLVVLSIFWSVDPTLSAERAFQSLSLTLLAVTAGSLLSLSRLIQALASLGLVLMLGSLIAVILVPDARGSETWPDAWLGIFGHKNGLGANATLALIMAIGGVMVSRGTARWVFLFGALLALGLLFGSQSRTSQLVATLSTMALLLGGLFRLFPRIWGVGYLAMIILLATAGILIFSTNWIVLLTDVLDRQPTLSGRLPLWSVVWPVALDRFWTGYGFQAFWDPKSSRVVALAGNQALLYIPFYSHSGLIEGLLNTGVVGVTLFFGAMVRALAGAFHAARHPSGRLATVTAIVYLLAFLMYNVTESLILDAHSTLWVAAAALMTKLALLLGRRSGRWKRRVAASRGTANPRRLTT